MSSEPGHPELSSFLARGDLPFCGRAALLSRLSRCWSATVHEAESGCVLLEGVEGQGKTRLLQEFARLAGRQDARILQVGWRGLPVPELDQLAQALEAQLPAPLPEWPALSVEQRLTRLLRAGGRQPLLLLLDDCEALPFAVGLGLIQLLRAPGMPPFLALLAGRPPLLLLRSSLESLLLCSLELEGLLEEDLRDLWQRLFAQDTSPAVCQVLVETSGGSPLALRHLLRSCLEAGWISGGGRGQLRLIPAELREQATLLLDAFHQGRLAVLQPAERRQLRRLGALGPVFSREAARRLLDDAADPLLDRLEGCGLAGPPLHPPRRVAGPATREALVEIWDHGLRIWLAGRPEPLPEATLDLLAGALPLYSLAPLLALEELVAGVPGVPWLERVLALAEQLVLAQQRSPDPSVGDRLSRAALAVLERRPDWRQLSSLRLAAGRLLVARLFLLKGQAGESVFLEQVGRLLELTEPCAEPALAELRLQTLIHLNRHHLRRGDPAVLDTRAAIEALLEPHPALRGHRAFRVFLGDLGLMAWGRGQHGTAGWVEQQVERLLAEDPDEESRNLLQQRVGVTLLAHFETSGQADRRLELARSLAAVVPASDAVFPAVRLHLLLQTGQLGEFLELWDAARQIWLQRGLQRNLQVAEAWHQAVLALCGEEPERLLPQQDPDPLRSAQETLRELPLLEVALLLGHTDWVGRRLGPLTITREAERAARRLQFLWARQAGGRQPGARRLRALPETDSEDPPRLVALFQCLANLDEGRLETGREQARALLAQPPARLDHLLILQTLLAVAGRTPALHEAARQALESALEWCVERQLGLVVRPWSRQFAGLLPAPRRRSWLRRAEQARVWSPPDQGAAETDRQRTWLQLIGGTRLRLAGEERERRIQGARMRTLLALLVADQLLQLPLPREEFRALAAGADHEASAAQVRNILAIGVHRLRRLLGPDAILGGADRPRLNPAQVQSDVQEVAGQLESAAQALHASRPQAAAQGVTEALIRLRRGLPFQDLFQPLFDSLRDDLETRARGVGLETIRALQAGGAVREARSLLEQLFFWHPDDEEVAGRLAEAYEAEGRQAEARVALTRHRQALADGPR
ncbi:MAG: AAA family ATPase [Candidatus Delongbacteria bacterium]